MCIAVLTVAVSSLAALLRWISYLLFCWHVVKRTNSSASLRDAAIAARAYRSASYEQLGQAVARMLRLPGGSD